MTTTATLPAPAQSVCPAADLLGEGLRWLHDTAQPATAIIDCRGAAVVFASANRLIRWYHWAGHGKPASSSTSPTLTGVWVWARP